MICPNCHSEVASIIGAVKNGQYLTRCEQCINSKVTYADFARKYERDRQREDYRKDIVQAWNGDKPNPDFIKAYPEVSKGRFTEEELRKYG